MYVSVRIDFPDVAFLVFVEEVIPPGHFLNLFLWLSWHWSRRWGGYWLSGCRNGTTGEGTTSSVLACSLLGSGHLKNRIQRF